MQAPAADLRNAVEEAWGSGVPLRIPFFEDAVFDVHSLQLVSEYATEWRGNPIRTWRGQIGDGYASGQARVVIVSGFDAIELTALFVDGSRLELRADQRANRFVAQVSEVRVDPSLDVVEPALATAGSQGSSGRGPSATSYSALASGVTYQDVLVLYTPAAETAIGDRLRITSWAVNRIDETNAAYAVSGNSGLLQLRLAGAISTTIAEPTGNEDVEDFRDAATGWSIGTDWQRIAHADLVILLGDQDGICGQAIFLKKSRINNPSPGNGFALVESHLVGGCTTTFTLTHEVGHLQGAQHNWEDRSEGAAEKYAYGYYEFVEEPPFRTVMSYTNPCDNAGVQCPRQLFFSDPDIFWAPNVPAGDAGRADNARMVAETRAIPSGYMDPIAMSDVLVGDFYYVPLGWALELGIAEGCSGSSFCPWVDAPRRDYVTWLWRSAGSPENPEWTEPFTDVTSSDAFYEAVLWAYNTGVTIGCTSSLFCPNDDVLRGEAMLFLWRQYGYPSETWYTEGFNDVSSADGDFWDAIKWASSEDITDGCSASQFCPWDPVLRSEAITFQFRAYHDFEGLLEP